MIGGGSSTTSSCWLASLGSVGNRRLASHPATAGTATQAKFTVTNNGETATTVP
jgi:hypothetical protein